jgi:Holliday junction resolvase RusA-like endonuclease
MYRIARGERRLVKEPEVATYQTTVTLIVRTTRSTWRPPTTGQIRVYYWFRLKNDIDCDNALKALNDAIATGLGIDDRRFLPCVVAKTTGHRDPSVHVELGDAL